MRWILGLIAAVMALASTAQAQSEFKDKDWTTGFFANCGFPLAKGGVDPVAWVQINQDRKLLFTLQKRQVGTCATDNMRRHRAPYWERMEVKQSGSLGLTGLHTIDFEVTFLDGFSGKRESFFQIHNWGKSCNAAPPLMMKMHRGALQIVTLERVNSNETGVIQIGRHRSVFGGKVPVASLYGKASRFRVVFDAQSKGRGVVSVSLNGQTLVEAAPIEFAICAAPHVKFGIYRPGGSSGLSRVAFDDLRIESE